MDQRSLITTTYQWRVDLKWTDDLPLNDSFFHVIGIAHGFLGLGLELEFELGQSPDSRAHLLLYILCADWQQYKCQVKFENYIFPPLRRRSPLTGHSDPLFDLDLRKAVWANWDAMWIPKKDDLWYHHRLFEKPIRLQDLARILIIKSLGG